MKHSINKAVCFVILVLFAVLSAYSDDYTVDLTSIVLESFNGDTTHDWNDGRHQRNFEFSWGLAASRFATKITDEDGNEVSYPRSMFIETWPVALFGNNRQGRELKSLGINGRFDRRGYNWIDVYPVQGEGDDAKPFEIPMPGRIRYIDLWVWSGNFNYYMEAYVRDYHGVVHKIMLGHINHVGWKNLRTNIPNHIPQSKRLLPAHAELQFVKFRIWTQPTESVSNFYVYLKQFKVLSDTFETFFDGEELADPDRITELWADNEDSGSTGR